MASNQLQKSILFTVAYFSALDYTLTPFELWRNLFAKGGLCEKVSYKEVLDELGKEPLVSKLFQSKGFVVLAKEGHLIEDRLKKQKLSLSKIRKIKTWTKVLSAIPYIRGIFLTGTLSMKNGSKKSDWDIFVVLAKNRIWVGRLFLSVVLQILGKRRHREKISERFCLNHYVTENGLILEEHNEFCSNFVSFSLPIFGEELHRKYLNHNQQWISLQKPNWDKEEVLNGTVSVGDGFSGLRDFLENFLEKTGLGKGLNSLAKKYMIKKIQNNPNTRIEGADIRYNDLALVFLPKPHRTEVLQKTLEKLTKCV